MSQLLAGLFFHVRPAAKLIIEEGAASSLMKPETTSATEHPASFSAEQGTQDPELQGESKWAVVSALNAIDVVVLSGGAAAAMSSSYDATIASVDKKIIKAIGK